MKNNTLTLLGRKIRSIREENGLSQEELADKANLHRTYIGAIERGERNLTVKSLKKIADALNVNIKELF